MPWPTKQTLCWLFLATCGCGGPLVKKEHIAELFASTHKETARVAAPDGQVEAVVVTTDGGATTSFGYKIFIVPSGARFRLEGSDGQVALIYGATDSEGHYGVRPSWEPDNTLCVDFHSARWRRYLTHRVTIGAQHYRVVLRQHSIEPQ